MNVFSRYLIRHLFLGFAAAAGLLLPLFTTFNLINELDDVSPGGYRWTQAVLVVLMTLPRTLVELSPFIALLGGIVGLGQLSKNSELTAIRSTGFSIFRIALVALVAGILWTVSLGAIDEWGGVAIAATGAANQIDRHRVGGRTMTLPAICFGPGAVMNL